MNKYPTMINQIDDIIDETSTLHNNFKSNINNNIDKSISFYKIIIIILFTFHLQIVCNILAAQLKGDICLHLPNPVRSKFQIV